MVSLLELIQKGENKMIKKWDIPTVTKHVTAEYDDKTGKMIEYRVSISVPTLNTEAEGSKKWIVRHFEDEFVFVYADTEKQAAIIATEVMLWDVVKVMSSLKNNRGKFYDSDGDRLEYDFRSKKFYLAEEDEE